MQLQVSTSYYICYISLAVVYGVGCEEIVSPTWPSPEADGPGFKGDG